MSKGTKIPSSPAMIAARLLPIVAAVLTLILLLTAMIPDGNTTVSFDSEAAVRSSDAYAQAVDAIRTILKEEKVENVSSVSFVYTDEDAGISVCDLKIVYNNGSENKVRYFRNGSETTAFKYSAGCRIILMNLFIPSERVYRSQVYDSFAVNVIFNDAKEGA